MAFMAKSESICIVHPGSHESPNFTTGDGYVEIGSSQGSEFYDCDRVFPAQTPQEKIFADIARGPIIDAVESFASTVFLAFGPTGSGKTFAITGGAKRFADRGLIPRSISSLFEALVARVDRDDFEVSVSFYEVYKDAVVDLLSERRRRLAVQVVEGQGPMLPGLIRKMAATESDAYSLLFTGDSNRHFEQLPSNPETSRGHVFYILHLTHLPSGREATLSFIDLAAVISTRNHATIAIERGLGALKAAAAAICAGEQPIFDSHILTQLMQPLLQPDVETMPPHLAILCPLKYSEPIAKEVHEYLEFSRQLKEAFQASSNMVSGSAGEEAVNSVNDIAPERFYLDSDPIQTDRLVVDPIQPQGEFVWNTVHAQSTAESLQPNHCQSPMEMAPQPDHHDDCFAAAQAQQRTVPDNMPCPPGSPELKRDLHTYQAPNEREDDQMMLQMPIELGSPFSSPMQAAAQSPLQTPDVSAWQPSCQSTWQATSPAGTASYSPPGFEHHMADTSAWQASLSAAWKAVVSPPSDAYGSGQGCEVNAPGPDVSLWQPVQSPWLAASPSDAASYGSGMAPVRGAQSVVTAVPPVSMSNWSPQQYADDANMNLLPAGAAGQQQQQPPMPGHELCGSPDSLAQSISLGYVHPADFEQQQQQQQQTPVFLSAAAASGPEARVDRYEVAMFPTVPAVVDLQELQLPQAAPAPQTVAVLQAPPFPRQTINAIESGDTNNWRDHQVPSTQPVIEVLPPAMGQHAHALAHEDGGGILGPQVSSAPSIIQLEYATEQPRTVTRAEYLRPQYTSSSQFAPAENAGSSQHPQQRVHDSEPRNMAKVPTLPLAGLGGSAGAGPHIVSKQGVASYPGTLEVAPPSASQVISRNVIAPKTSLETEIGMPAAIINSFSSAEPLPATKANIRAPFVAPLNIKSIPSSYSMAGADTPDRMFSPSSAAAAHVRCGATTPKRHGLSPERGGCTPQKVYPEIVARVLQRPDGVPTPLRAGHGGHSAQLGPGPSRLASGPSRSQGSRSPAPPRSPQRSSFVGAAPSSPCASRSGSPLPDRQQGSARANMYAPSAQLSAQAVSSVRPVERASRRSTSPMPSQQQEGRPPRSVSPMPSQQMQQQNGDWIEGGRPPRSVSPLPGQQQPVLQATSQLSASGAGSAWQFQSAPSATRMSSIPGSEGTFTPSMPGQPPQVRYARLSSPARPRSVSPQPQAISVPDSMTASSKVLSVAPAGLVQQQWPSTPGANGLPRGIDAGCYSPQPQPQPQPQPVGTTYGYGLGGGDVQSQQFNNLGPMASGRGRTGAYAADANSFILAGTADNSAPPAPQLQLPVPGNASPLPPRFSSMPQPSMSGNALASLASPGVPCIGANAFAGMAAAALGSTSPPMPGNTMGFGSNALGGGGLGSNPGLARAVDNSAQVQQQQLQQQQQQQLQQQQQQQLQQQQPLSPSNASADARWKREKNEWAAGLLAAQERGQAQQVRGDGSVFGGSSSLGVGGNSALLGGIAMDGPAHLGINGLSGLNGSFLGSNALGSDCGFLSGPDQLGLKFLNA